MAVQQSDAKSSKQALQSGSEEPAADKVDNNPAAASALSVERIKELNEESRRFALRCMKPS